MGQSINSPINCLYLGPDQLVSGLVYPGPPQTQVQGSGLAVDDETYLSYSYFLGPYILQNSQSEEYPSTQEQQLFLEQPYQGNSAVKSLDCTHKACKLTRVPFH